jgi:hypothetical protein
MLLAASAARTGAAAAIAAALVIVAAPSPASAEHDVDHICRVSASWDFARPLPALSGRSLATYLQRHNDGNRHVPVVI